MLATDKIELTRLAYDDGGYIYSTLLTSDATPFATVKKGTGENGGDNATYVLLSPDVKPVYSFTIKTPDKMENHACSSTLIFINEGNSYYLQEILVTQHLFNDDDLYEVIIELGEDGDEGYASVGGSVAQCVSHCACFTL